MASAIGGGRPVRFCPLCQQADDHPRHVLTSDPEGVARHLDCCRDAGCPDGSCVEILGDAKPGVGVKMLDHIQKVTS